MSVERERMCVSARSTFKKVEIVYYLSRNGHLEHPHYMELTHLAHQHLRLKGACTCYHVYYLIILFYIISSTYTVIFLFFHFSVSRCCGPPHCPKG